MFDGILDFLIDEDYAQMAADRSIEGDVSSGSLDWFYEMLDYGHALQRCQSQPVDIDLPITYLHQPLPAGEMRDLICEKMHELDRDFVYSRLLEMGAFFSPSDLPSLLLYFDNLYLLDEE